MPNLDIETIIKLVNSDFIKNLFAFQKKKSLIEDENKFILPHLLNSSDLSIGEKGNRFLEECGDEQLQKQFFKQYGMNAKTEKGRCLYKIYENYKYKQYLEDDYGITIWDLAKIKDYLKVKTYTTKENGKDKTKFALSVGISFRDCPIQWIIFIVSRYFQIPICFILGVLIAFTVSFRSTLDLNILVGLLAFTEVAIYTVPFIVFVHKHEKALAISKKINNKSIAVD